MLNSLLQTKERNLNPNCKLGQMLNQMQSGCWYNQTLSSENLGFLSEDVALIKEEHQLLSTFFSPLKTLEPLYCGAALVMLN